MTEEGPLTRYLSKPPPFCPLRKKQIEIRICKSKEEIYSERNRSIVLNENGWKFGNREEIEKKKKTDLEEVQKNIEN